MGPAVVTIGIPNLDMVGFVEEAIESALAQTYAHVEVVVVDNHSGDGSWERIQAFSRRDPRVRCLRNPVTLRMPCNWNRCLREARGEWFNLLSADDRLHPEFVEECLALARAHPRIGYVFSHREKCDERGQVLRASPFYDASGVIPGRAELRVNWGSNHNTPSETLIHRERFVALGGYDERFDWAHDIHAKLMLSLDWDVGYVAKALCTYRVHGASSTARIHRDKLGVMEIYRVKLDVLARLDASERVGAEHAIGANLARQCRALAREWLREGETELSRQYLELAASFSSEVESAERPRAPYPLPPGSVRLPRATAGPEITPADSSPLSAAGSS